VITELVSESLIDESFRWLCKQRKHFPVNSDVWHCRFHWDSIKPTLKRDLSSNRFTFQPLQKVTKASGEVIHLWTSIDSVVLKLLSLVLTHYLPSSKLCTHLKGHGGSKQTVTSIQAEIPNNTFVFRTDVKSYYESINHEILLDKLSVYIKDKMVMNLLSQYLKRSVESGGLFKDIKQGISSGCPLSPLISSFYLYELDKEMEDKPVFYRRYMDDIIILSPSRWKLRKAIKTVNQHFEKLKLKQHPDKTTIGRITNGFDFLGYQFGKDKITVSIRTLQNHIRRITQLYEQKKHLPNWKMLIDDYRQHWVTWVYSGIPSSIINFDTESVELRLFLKST
jgi:RNA-directed DNA polymerase